MEVRAFPLITELMTEQGANADGFTLSIDAILGGFAALS
jgi:hypothetical protein